MADNTTIRVKILHHEFSIKASEKEADLIEEIAADVAKRIQSLSRKSSLSTERIAIMTAFQYAFELRTKELETPLDGKSKRVVKDKIDQMIKRIDRAVKDK